jgi:hypothetical protein
MSAPTWLVAELRAQILSLELFNREYVDDHDGNNQLLDIIKQLRYLATELEKHKPTTS